jgi:cadmium resistance protein CadD (predicted permease)
MLATVLLAAILFVATDVDDLVVLTMLFALAPNRRRQIVVGQFLGICILVAASAAAALSLLALPTGWIRWIGLVPLILGIWALVAALRGSAEEAARPPGMVGVFSTALLTLAGGGDNLAAYVPVLHRMPRADWPYLFGVFAIGVLLWCVLASWLGGHPSVQDLINRAGHWIVPAVYIAIGLWIVI